MSKKKNKKFNEFHFVYKNDARGEEITKFLKNQKHKGQSVELALLLAINEFGNDDLLESLESFFLENNIGLYSDLKGKKDKKQILPENVKQKHTKSVSAEKPEKKHTHINSKNEHTKSKVSSSNNEKPKKESADIKDELSTEDINKILWDGNSSSL